MTAAVLEVLDVSKHYGRLEALKHVSLRVMAGEFVALLGPNGAGKTTLFQVLTGLYSPDTGSVRIAGADIRQRSQVALAQMGVVFQQPTIDLDLSLHRNLQFHAMLHGMSRQRRNVRIRQALQQSGLASRADEKVRVLSGGNRRRAELVRALLHEPALLLMDEPSVGLDPASRQQLIEDVHHLCAASSTGVLWATHLVDEAERADRIIILHHGRVLADLPPQELVRQQRATDINSAFLAMTNGNHLGQQRMQQR